VSRTDSPASRPTASRNAVTRVLRAVPRYWRTIRHLRLIQLVYQVRNRLPRPVVRPPTVLGLRAQEGSWHAGPRRPRSLHYDDSARFLGVERKVDGALGWRDEGEGMLWLYNLHYFDDLIAAPYANYRQEHLRWILRWIEENPQGTGPGWDPYPTSLRIVNWVKAGLEGFSLPPMAIASLALQSEHLQSRIEHHLCANHLFANAKALMFAGLFLDGPSADRWFDIGSRLLEAELAEQVLSDGGHYENSPMYGAVIHEDLLDLIQVMHVFGRAVPENWREVASRMAHWHRHMLHPDGGIAFFNDAALGIASSFADRSAYGSMLGVSQPVDPDHGIHTLAASGYHRLQAGQFVVLADAAAVGPNYQPGHAHADTLSFEMSWRGQRVFVNTGTSCYGAGPQRRYERSTPAHNTLCLGGQDSSEVWGSFRVGRRAGVMDAWTSNADGDLRLGAAHDGYRHLPGAPIHRRTWSLCVETLRVEDVIEGNSGLAGVARLQLAPGVMGTVTNSHEVHLVLPDGGELCVLAEGASIQLVPSIHSPRFGVCKPTTTLCFEMTGRRLITRVEAVE
jgi:uncharacterized heparinase superfamily protein